MTHIFYSYLLKVFRADLFNDKNFLLRNTYENNPFGGNVDKVFNACCNAIVASNKTQSVEYKFAKFYLILINKVDSGLIKDFIRHLASRYVTGHFMNIKEVNIILPELVAEFNKILSKNT
ncbi:hypothetical protein [Rahnella sikkimica]|uniref:Uncharacterized protein n=1 Tax=Rahnella sikkimica TaxID=1805933 RepID=A0A2L1UYS3_9GAMM|nr:hypothetical protein [Rahnella sikkimica]AVF38112.1 hypothetical protein BV494_24775 [Rahnella sikkimica]